MARSLIELVILSIQSGILAIILGFFIYRRMRLKIHSLDWFVWIFAFGLLQGLYEIIFYILEVNGVTICAHYVESHKIIYSFALLVLFFFLENLEYNQPRFWSTGIVLSLEALFIVSYFNEMSLTLNSSLVFNYHIWIIAFDLLQITIMAFALVVFYRIFDKADSRLLRRISLLFVIAFVILVIVALLEFTENFIAWQIPDVYFFTVVFFYLAIIYIVFPYFVYLAPYDIYNLMLINQTGLLIYNCRLVQDESDKDNALLIGGAISGLETFLKSFFKTEDSLESIKMANRSLIMVTFANLTVVAIVEKQSSILKNAMKQFVKETIAAYPELNSEKSKVILDHERVKGIGTIIARVFPFVQAEEIFPIEIASSSETEQSTY
jgi:hypothetical protein